MAVTETLGLPPGYDPDTGELLFATVPTPPSTQTLVIPIPSGEAWLVHWISGQGDTHAGGFNRILAYEILDNNPVGADHTISPNANFRAIQPVLLVDNTTFQWTFGLGLEATTEALIATVVSTQQSLPMMVIPAGWRILLNLDGAVGTDRIGQSGVGHSNGVLYCYTRWETGAGGGGTAVPIGPYLYVPGPEAVAA